jgi:hypothetical protein
VDISNLQRQVIHHTDDIGRDKVTSAANKLRAINPDVTVKEFHLRAEASNVLDLIKDHDFVVDGTDNFAAKFLMSIGERSAILPSPNRSVRYKDVLHQPTHPNYPYTQAPIGTGHSPSRAGRASEGNNRTARRTGCATGRDGRASANATNPADSACTATGATQ